MRAADRGFSARGRGRQVDAAGEPPSYLEIFWRNAGFGRGRAARSRGRRGRETARVQGAAWAGRGLSGRAARGGGGGGTRGGRGRGRGTGGRTRSRRPPARFRCGRARLCSTSHARAGADARLAPACGVDRTLRMPFSGLSCRIDCALSKHAYSGRVRL